MIGKIQLIDNYPEQVVASFSKPIFIQYNFSYMVATSMILSLNAILSPIQELLLWTDIFMLLVDGMVPADWILWNAMIHAQTHGRRLPP